MLLIFPRVRLHCVSSASKTCLDYVWAPFWALTIKNKIQGPAQKWNPKQGPKLDPNHDTKMQSGTPNLYGDANKDVCRDDLHSAVGLLDDLIKYYFLEQQTNNFNQRRKGNLGG